MQRFTFIHDGSDQGWQTAYLAFHIAAQLGAPLQALLGASTDRETLVQSAAQVEIGGRAAGLTIATHLVTDFSLDSLTANTNAIDGLFIPHRLVPDGKTAARFQEALSCPLWIVSQGPEIHKMAALVSDFVADEKLIHYTTTLAHRLQQVLIGLVQAGELTSVSHRNPDLEWEPLPNFSPREIASLINRLDINLFFISVSKASLINELNTNCVLFPAT